ncbi:MAG TPA: tripartite tricarboxylate transporter substrate binding protein [Xanthobacteraceae bacterium]|nr:tripartite tricarboxylate transporter substrate binding protein [Xanthobacteraceae bacterium]
MWCRALAMFALVLGSTGASTPEAYAQAWPNKPLHVIVPVTAGSAIDIIARTVSDQLAARLGQPVVVENRTGAGGTIGAASVAKADPDGYTILVHSSAHVIAPSTFPNLPYDAGRDFSGVMPLANVPLVLIVAPEKYKTIGGLVTYARAKPGGINYATVGAGAAAHLTAERFRLSAGFQAQQIPFRGAPEAITEVMAGRVDFFFSPTLPTLPLLRDNKLAALAVSSSRRASALPDVPTTVEAGYADSDYNFWIGMFVPAKTPRDVVDRLYRETAQVLQNAGVQEKLAALGAEPMAMTPQEFDSFLRDEIAMNARLVKAAGIKAN